MALQVLVKERHPLTWFALTLKLVQVVHIAPDAAAAAAIKVTYGWPTRDHISRSLCFILAKSVPV